MNHIFTPSKKIFFFVFALSIIFLSSNRAGAQALPAPDHIVVLIEENQSNDEVIGNSPATVLGVPIYGNSAPTTYAPYTNDVANDTNTALLTNMFALTHPSQPNYFHLFSGNDQGVLDDNLPAQFPFTTPNLARQLLDKGLTFKTYSEDLPSVGSNIESSGLYARKHNPVANWMGNGTNGVPDSLNQPFTAFPTDFNQLPTVSFVVPNEVNDMHDGSGKTAVEAGDTWFQQNLDNFVQWCKTHNTLLIYTFDEDDGLFNNNIPTYFTGAMVKHGSYSDHWNLYNILRTIEDIYGLSYAGNAATAAPIANIWKEQISGVKNIGADEQKIVVYPDPATSEIYFNVKENEADGAEVSVFNAIGEKISSSKFSTESTLTFNTFDYQSGLYFYRIEREGQLLQTGRFSVIH